MDLTLSYSSSNRSLAVKTNSLDFFDFLLPRKAKPFEFMSLIKNYLHTKMTETTDNIINRDSLQEAYINMIVDGMDWKTMEQFVYDTIDANLDNYTVEELITEVKDYYPELLEEDTVSVTYGDKLQESS